MDIKKAVEYILLYVKNNALRFKIENPGEVSKPIAEALTSGNDKLEKVLSRIEVMKGEPGEKPSESELLDLINPLIPPKAEDGYTPVKFKDYFTKEEQKQIVDIIESRIKIPVVKDGVTPKPGIDYPSHEQVSKFIGESVAEIPTPKNGISPKHEWNGTKIRFQNGDGTWGKWTNLKGKDGAGKTVSVFGDSGAKFFRDLLDAPRGYGGQSGKFLKVKTTEDGLEFSTS